MPNNGICIVQLPIYIHLLTVTRWPNKAAVVTKNACKSICLGVQDIAGALIIMLITQAADTIKFVWHNKFIDTYPTSLLTPIREFLTFLQFEDES